MLHANDVGKIGESARGYNLDQGGFRNAASAVLSGFTEQQKLYGRPDYFRRLASCDAP